jgi:hypothetical protein
MKIVQKCVKWDGIEVGRGTRDIRKRKVHTGND